MVAVVVFVGPSTTFGIMYAFFKPALRRTLLRWGLRRFADKIVPDLKGGVTEMKSVVGTVSQKMDGVKLTLDAFLAKQKLPRLMDITPEIPASTISLKAADILGSGGYGAVYKASYGGKSVAVKALFGEAKDVVVPPNIAKMMRREATIMCSLNHPNILRVHGVVSERGWIVMDLCEGGALDEALKDPEEAFDDATQTRLCAEVATGVAYLHMKEVSIIHGDMKAGNVLLTRDRSARLCDFGLSEAKNRSKTMTSAANAGSKSNALTVAWSAPELFTAEPKSFATDVYALGLTLWEIYERATPFASMPEAAVVSQVLAGRRPKLAKTPASVRRLVEKCWSEDPKERPGADRVALMLTNLWTNHPGRQPDADESGGDERGKEPEADAKEKEAEADAKAKKEAEAEAKAKMEAEAKAKKEAEADAKAKKEAEAKAKKEAEAEAKAKKEAEAKAKKEAEAEAKAKKEAEAKAKKEADAKAKAAASSAPASAPPDLHSRLRAWREREARELGDAPLSDVFDDKTLAKIAVANPKTLAALGKLRGVGPEKVSAFGDDVLEIIRGEGASAAEDIDVRVE